MFISGGISQAYDDGEVVFFEGDAGRHMYIIESGSVELSRTSMLESREVMTPLITLGKGDFFGEMALFDSGSRSATARAIGSTVVRRISRKDLEAAMAGDADLAREFLDRMSGRLRKTDQALERLMVDRTLTQAHAADLEAARYSEHF